MRLHGLFVIEIYGCGGYAPAVGGYAPVVGIYVPEIEIYVPVLGKYVPPRETNEPDAPYMCLSVKYMVPSPQKMRPPCEYMVPSSG